MPVVTQWQKSKGKLIVTAALELLSNQVVHFYSDKKNTAEMVKMLDLILVKFACLERIHISWDAASWHVAKALYKKIEANNAAASVTGSTQVEIAPLPSGAQFLNVIEAVFSGMARAVIHNSDYTSVDEAKAAIDAYFSERNAHFLKHPKRAGRKIWGMEKVTADFSEWQNCKNPRYR